MKPETESVEIASIAGTPVTKDGGLFISARVTIWWMNERGTGTTVDLNVFAPFDPADTIDALHRKIFAEATVAMAEASKRLTKARPEQSR